MSQATASRVMLADNSALDTNPLFISFTECGLLGAREFGRDEGHRGTRQQSSCRSRVLSDKSAGPLAGTWSPDEIDWMLTRCLGDGDGTALDPWVFAEAISGQYALVDKVAAKYLYNVWPSALEISGQEKQYLRWMVDYVGAAESVWATSWPATPTAPACDTAFLFSDCTLTYDSDTYKLQNFRLRIDNAIDGDQLENAITPSRFETTDAIVTLEAQCAFRADTLDLYRAAVAGAAASLAITDGTTTYTFTFANAKIPNGGPTIPAQGRINMPVSMQCYRTAAAQQISIVKS